MPTVNECKIVSFQNVAFEKGDLTSVNYGSEINFPVKRIYYLTGVGAGEIKGNHANIKNQQVIIALKGSFHVTVNDGVAEQTFVLDSHKQGLLVREKIWRTVHDFSEDAICLVICSEEYDPTDYVKDHSEFLKIKGETGRV